MAKILQLELIHDCPRNRNNLLKLAFKCNQLVSFKLKNEEQYRYRRYRVLTQIENVTLDDHANDLIDHSLRVVKEHALIKLSLECKELRHLTLSNCFFTDAVLMAFSKNCTKLQSLNVDSINNITNDGIAKLAKQCSSLQSLHISFRNTVNDVAARALALGCKQLTALTLSGGITETGLKCLVNGGIRLRLIRLEERRYIKSPLNVISMLKQFEQLEMLIVGESIDSDTYPPFIEAIKEIKKLNYLTVKLSGGNFTYTSHKEIQSL